MAEQENTRIAVLTSGALKQSTEKVVKEILATVGAVEANAREFREQAERVIAEITRNGDDLAAQAVKHVENCDAAMKNMLDSQSLLANLLPLAPQPNFTNGRSDDVQDRTVLPGQ
jgi:hypothetical protein